MIFEKVIPELKIQPEYQSFVDEFVTEVRHCFGDTLHSVYMCGSIPKGIAVQGRSDADFTLILTKEPSEAELDSLKRLELQLLQSYSFFTKIDTPYSTVDEVLMTPYDWGFWIKILCICVSGEDLGKSIPDFEPSNELVRGINGETEKVLSKLIESCKDSSDRQVERKLIKRLLRALYSMTLNRESRWIDDFEQQAKVIKKHYPEWKADVDFLLKSLESPVGKEKTRLIEIGQGIYRKIMTDYFFSIENLFHKKSLVPELAERLFNEFIKDRIPHVSEEDMVSALNKRKEAEPPVTYVAMAGSEWIGTVSIFPQDLRERDDLTPWLGALYVKEAWRNLGIGKKLITFVQQKAKEIGYDKLYLRTEEAAAYYQGLGWNKIDHLIDEHGLEVHVFEYELV